MGIFRVEYNRILPEAAVRFESGNSVFFFIVKSAATVCIDSRSKRFDSPQLFYLLPGHELTLARSGGPAVYDYLEFSLTDEQMTRFRALELPLVPSAPPNFADIQALVKAIYYLFYSSDRYIEEKLYGHLINLVYTCASGDESASDVSEKGKIRHSMRRLRVLMFDNPTAFPTVEAAARYVGLSPSRFQHLYREYFQTTFSKDMIFSKMRRACTLLHGTSYSIAQIAEELGYTNDTYFYLQFKREIGVSPTVYRQTDTTLV